MNCIWQPSLAWCSRKSLRRISPEVRIRMSSGDDGDVYKCCLILSWLTFLLKKVGLVHMVQYLSLDFPYSSSSFPSSTKCMFCLIAVVISSLEVYGQQMLNVRLDMKRRSSGLVSSSSNTFLFCTFYCPLLDSSLVLPGQPHLLVTWSNLREIGHEYRFPWWIGYKFTW